VLSLSFTIDSLAPHLQQKNACINFNSAKMSDCISNLREIIEPESRLFRVLRERCELIPAYQNMGPADLCYLVKEHKGGYLSATTRTGYFHYVYGVDCSSSASVAVYINSLIKG